MGACPVTVNRSHRGAQRSLEGDELTQLLAREMMHCWRRETCDASLSRDDQAWLEWEAKEAHVRSRSQPFAHGDSRPC